MESSLFGTAKIFKLADHLGSTRVMLKPGLPAETSDYEPFRSLLAGTDARKGFIDKERDDESLLGDYGVRKYDPETGRFLSVDPLWEKQTQWSPYPYSHDNPTSKKDPDGRFPALLIAMARGALVNAVAEFGSQLITNIVSDYTDRKEARDRRDMSFLAVVKRAVTNVDYGDVGWEAGRGALSMGFASWGGSAEKLGNALVTMGTILMKSSVDMTLDGVQVVGGNKNAAQFSIDAVANTMGAFLTDKIAENLHLGKNSDVVQFVYTSAVGMLRKLFANIAKTAAESQKPDR